MAAQSDLLQNSIAHYLKTSPSKRLNCNNASDESIKLFQIPLDSLSQLDNVRARKLAKAVLNDVSSQECAWNDKIKVEAWRMLKELSRSPISSCALSEEMQINQIVQIIHSLKDTISSDNDKKSEKKDSNLEQLDLSLRVLNNILFQHSEGRQVYSTSSVGMQICLDLIENFENPILTFLCARLIFFATMTPTEVLKDAVHSMQLVEIFTIRISTLLQLSLKSEVEMAITEMLKAFFNVSLHLPKLTKSRTKATKSKEDGEEDEFEHIILPFLAPVVRVLIGTHQQGRTKFELKSPYTNAITVLLNYPVQPYEQIWQTGTLPLENEEGQRIEEFGKKGKARSSSAGGYSDSDKSSTNSTMSRSRRIANSLFRSPFQKYISQQQYTTQQQSGSSSNPNLLLINVLNMVESFLTKYFASSDVDDKVAKDKASKDDVDIEATGEPALLLLQKLANGSETFRSFLKSKVLPNDIDREIGLDKRDDLTGILIRLMGSQTYSRLARASGEMLLSLCEGRINQMTSEIGYGPCAGFLTNTGRAHAIPSESKRDAQGRLLDPITGKVLPTVEEMERQDEESGLSKMTEEEKEAEAERLFSLFDRLDKTGIVKVDPNSHPMRKAVETGKIEEIDEEEEKRKVNEEKEKEKELEESVNREMRQFRERQKRNVP